MFADSFSATSMNTGAVHGGLFCELQSSLPLVSSGIERNRIYRIDTRRLHRTTYYLIFVLCEKCLHLILNFIIFNLEIIINIRVICM